MPFAFNQSPLTILPSTLVERARLSENDVVILTRNSEVLVSECSPLLRARDIDFFDKSLLLQLGQYKTQRIFIHYTSGEDVNTKLDTDWWDLRRIAVEMISELASISGQACAISHWHSNHRFCGKCGSHTHLGKEHSRVCNNVNCKETTYPRVDPAIIVSVVNQNDQILLGHKANWDPGRYSVIAGFMGHGESLENCVAREVKEETGVNIDSFEYICSQPWPFPGSIMIGFHATASTQLIAPADDELEDVIWIGRQALREKVKNSEIKLPHRYSISRYLVEIWLNQQS